jgi:hypothetical protein
MQSGGAVMAPPFLHCNGINRRAAVNADPEVAGNVREGLPSLAHGDKFGIAFRLVQLVRFQHVQILTW